MPEHARESMETAMARKKKPLNKEQIKSVSYSATENKLLLDVDSITDEDTVKTANVGDIEITNTGKIPSLAILGYRLWTDATTMTGTTYQVNYLLKPNQSITIPDVPAVISDETVEQLIGTAVDNATPTATANFMYSDSGATLGEDVDDDETDFDVSDGDYFRVNDLIQLGINTTTATRIEIMRVTAISTNNLTVKRALFGTSAADKDAQTSGTSGAVSGAKVYFPYFNIYGGEYNRYTVAQTNASGRFHAMNYFGVGRGATNLMGITSGSVAIKFFDAGWQNLTKSGDITSSTEMGLTAGSTYYLSVSIDGATTDKITFTVDSSNTRAGGANGIISKLQASIDALYYNPAKNGFEKGATVGIVSGNIRVTSKQRLSTSAISVTTNTDGVSGTDELFDASNIIGRFPAVIPTAIAAKLPDDVKYDSVDYASSPNENAFIYDDGYGHLFSNMGAKGHISYETGEINFSSAPANSEFVYSCLHTSPFSGRANATNTAKMNKLKAIYGNLPNSKGTGELTIKRR